MVQLRKGAYIASVRITCTTIETEIEDSFDLINNVIIMKTPLQ